jgi:adenylate kinase
MTRLVMLGPPGAGKGTQAQLVAARLGVPAVSTGDLFRAAAADDSDLGRAARSAMAAGRLVPDLVTNALVTRRLKAEDAADGFLLDGFPRTLDQAAQLDRMLAARAERLNAVLLLRAGEDEIVRRLAGRRTCHSCAAVWHVDFRPTRHDGLCDACCGELYQRQDDTEATVRERLRVYDTQTAPLVDFYAAVDLLTEIDAVGTVEDINDAITDALNQALQPVDAA